MKAGKIKNKQFRQLEDSEFHEATLQMLGENTVAIAHEIKAPLAGINAHLQLLEKNLIKEGVCPDKAKFSILYAEIKRMSDLCDHILSLSSDQAGERRLVDIGEICMDTCALLRAVAIKEDIVLEVLLDQQLPKVRVAEDQIRRVLVNLVINAIQAVAGCYSNKEIIIRLAKERDMVKISVEDNGPGICISEQEKIFSPRYSTKVGGNGLGLTLCSQIAKAHQGRLTV